MKFKRIKLAFLCALFLTPAFSQNSTQTSKSSAKGTLADHKFSVSTSYLTFLNFEPEEENIHHYELHFGYRITPKDKIGIKVATWKLYASMGMPMKEQLKFDKSNNYPGRLRETGFGVTYQRMLWKGLFATIEILPQLQTYLDENDNKIGNGFKLYTSYHLGYYIPLFKNRMYIEPQIHCNYWPIDTNTPPSFQEIDNEWNNYFLFEPNIYIGVNF
jgi:hypothetical protein